MTSQDPVDPSTPPASAPGAAAPGPSAEGPDLQKAADKRPLTIGQRLALGCFTVGFALVSLIIVWAQVRARHPHY